MSVDPEREVAVTVGPTRHPAATAELLGRRGLDLLVVRWLRRAAPSSRI